jgi:chitin-binding protein
VSHNVNLGNHTGRQKVLAIWNIGDTANAFYACVDLQVK